MAVANAQTEGNNVAQEKVILVCLHGAAKNVIASALFDRLVDELRAAAAGS